MAGFLALAVPETITPAVAAELLLFEQDGCPFCRKFDEEIAPDYPRSKAGQIAPLRRVDIFEGRRGGIEGLSPAVFTPTFVLVDDGREIGRLEGYPGKRWFYPEIERLLERLPESTQAIEEKSLDPGTAEDLKRESENGRPAAAVLRDQRSPVD